MILKRDIFNLKRRHILKTMLRLHVNKICATSPQTECSDNHSSTTIYTKIHIKLTRATLKYKTECQMSK
jgi:hypothetical protein